MNSEYKKLKDYNNSKENYFYSTKCGSPWTVWSLIDKTNKGYHVYLSEKFKKSNSFFNSDCTTEKDYSYPNGIYIVSSNGSVPNRIPDELHLDKTDSFPIGNVLFASRNLENLNNKF